MYIYIYIYIYYIYKSYGRRTLSPGFGGGGCCCTGFESDPPILFIYLFFSFNIYLYQLYPGTQLTCTHLRQMKANEIRRAQEPLYIYWL